MQLTVGIYCRDARREHPRIQACEKHSCAEPSSQVAGQLPATQLRMPPKCPEMEQDSLTRDQNRSLRPTHDRVTASQTIFTYPSSHHFAIIYNASLAPQLPNFTVTSTHKDRQKWGNFRTYRTPAIQCVRSRLPRPMSQRVKSYGSCGVSMQIRVFGLLSTDNTGQHKSSGRRTSRWMNLTLRTPRSGNRAPLNLPALAFKANQRCQSCVEPRQRRTWNAQ